MNRGTVAVGPSVLAEDESLATTCTDDEIFAHSDHDALRAAIQRLPSDYRDTVLLHCFSELPIVKVARILGISEGTVKWRLSMARKVKGRTLTDYVPLARKGNVEDWTRRWMEAKLLFAALLIVGFYEIWGFQVAIPVRSGISGAFVVAFPNRGSFCYNRRSYEEHIGGSGRRRGGDGGNRRGNGRASRRTSGCDDQV